MSLTPATTDPQPRGTLLSLFQEVLDDGAPDAWYIIREYDNHATARDVSSKHSKRFHGLTITADKGVVYARKNT